MDEKVIRTQITQGISSRLIRFNNEAETMQSLCLKYGKEVLLKEIFNEKILSFLEELKSMGYSKEEIIQKIKEVE